MKQMNEVIHKKIWSLAFPISLEIILSITLLLTDTYFLSRVSDHMAGSVASTLPIIILLIFLFNAMAQGGGSVASQYLGAKKGADAASAYTAAFLLNLAAGLFFSIFFFLFHQDIVIWLGFSTDILEYASLYFSIVGAGMVLLAIKSFYFSAISSTGKMYWNTSITLIANFVNIVLNIAFINGVFGASYMGVKGVAIATVAAYIISVGLSAALVHIKLKIYFTNLWARQSLKKYMYSILSIALPSALEPVSYHLSQVCISILFIQLGYVALAARSYSFNIAEINFIWYYSIALATQILVSHLTGAQMFNRIHQQVISSLKQVILGSFIISGLVFAFAGQAFHIFTSNPEVIELGTTLLGLAIIYGPLCAINTVISYALRSTGDAKYTAYMGIVVMWVIGIPFCYLVGISMKYGAVGIFAGMTIDEFIRAILHYRRWQQRHWQHKGVVMNTELSS
jgi:putative MATE family efflux protein